MPNKRKRDRQGQNKKGENPSVVSQPVAGEQDSVSTALTPRLEPLPAEEGKSPESGIGKRIRYARNQLTFSIEALSRYSANFDRDEKKGVSPTSLLRYETGEFLPGARELRILCDALDVPVRWLLYGEMETPGDDVQEQKLLSALGEYVLMRAAELRPESKLGTRKAFPRYDLAARYRWMLEAKQSKSKG